MQSGNNNMKLFLAILLVLVLASNVSQNKIVASQHAMDTFLNSINCNQDTDITATKQVLTAYQTCRGNTDMSDAMCMLPCMANEMGLVTKDRLIHKAVKKLLKNQFRSLDTANIKRWKGGILTCFGEYRLSEEKFPTLYNDCYEQTEALLKLSTCILAKRNCTGGIGNELIPEKPRKKRELTFLKGFGAGTLIGIAAGLSISAIKNSQECGNYGCHKGLCYAYCGLSNQGGDWCYTTKTYSQSFAYVKCNSTKDCNGCWKCAGSCTL